MRHRHCWMKTETVWEVGLLGFFAMTLMLAFAGGVKAQEIDWIRQFGTANSDHAFSVSVDASGVYVAGCTYCYADHDAFVRKYDIAGNEVWTRQFGTETRDDAYSVSVDASGVYVAGATTGTLPGQTSAGDHDAYVVKLSSEIIVDIDIKPGSFPNSINLGPVGRFRLQSSPLLLSLQLR